MISNDLIKLFFFLSTYALSSTFAQGAVLVRLYDGTGGATCDYFDAASRLRWLQRGGDWLDIDGVVHGNKPFAVQQVLPAARPSDQHRFIELDLMKLL